MVLADWCTLGYKVIFRAKGEKGFVRCNQTLRLKHSTVADHG